MADTVPEPEQGNKDDEPTPDSLEDLLTIILAITDEAALVAHCKRAVIKQDDFANLILACDLDPGFPIRHLSIFQHHQPRHLELTAYDRMALVTARVGPLEGGAKKAVGKIGQMFAERRMFCAHMFWVRDSGAWQLFYFDQRDIADRTHWEHGSHVHLMNWLTHPTIDPNDLLADLRAEPKPKLGGSIYVRYADTGRERRGSPGRADSDFEW